MKNIRKLDVNTIDLTEQEIFSFSINFFYLLNSKTYVILTFKRFDRKITHCHSFYVSKRNKMKIDLYAIFTKLKQNCIMCREIKVFIFS